MANWRRIKKLRERIATLPAMAVRMDRVLLIDRDEETVKQAREAHCGTVGCIAGHSFCLFAKPALKLVRSEFDGWTNIDESGVAVMKAAQELLGLTDDERTHMFCGIWHPSISNEYEAGSVKLGKIRRVSILRYLDKAIAAKDIMVKL